MPQAIHENLAFNSRNREVAIHCVFSASLFHLFKILFVESRPTTEVTLHGGA